MVLINGILSFLDGTTSNANANEHLSVAFQTLGEQIYTKVRIFEMYDNYELFYFDIFSF